MGKGGEVARLPPFLFSRLLTGGGLHFSGAAQRLARRCSPVRELVPEYILGGPRPADPDLQERAPAENAPCHRRGIVRPGGEGSVRPARFARCSGKWMSGRSRLPGVRRVRARAFVQIAPRLPLRDSLSEVRRRTSNAPQDSTVPV